MLAGHVGGFQFGAVEHFLTDGAADFGIAGAAYRMMFQIKLCQPAPDHSQGYVRELVDISVAHYDRSYPERDEKVRSGTTIVWRASHLLLSCN